MIRRILTLLAALFLMTGSAFAAEQHAEIQFVIHQGDSETAVTADLLLREKEIVVLSGLFPSYALSLPCDGAAEGFNERVRIVFRPICRASARCCRGLIRC